jgi:hypothetical protein
LPVKSVAAGPEAEAPIADPDDDDEAENKELFDGLDETVGGFGHEGLNEAGEITDASNDELLAGSVVPPPQPASTIASALIAISRVRLVSKQIMAMGLTSYQCSLQSAEILGAARARFRQDLFITGESSAVSNVSVATDVARWRLGLERAYVTIARGGTFRCACTNFEKSRQLSI